MTHAPAPQLSGRRKSGGFRFDALALAAAFGVAACGGSGSGAETSTGGSTGSGGGMTSGTGGDTGTGGGGTVSGTGGAPPGTGGAGAGTDGGLGGSGGDAVGTGGDGISATGGAIDGGATATGGGGSTTSWPPAVPGSPAFTGPTIAGTITVDRTIPMGHLAPGFAGFSYEKTHISDGFFTGADAPLIALYKLLGPGIVRIGANDVDKSTWVPAAPAVAAGAISFNVGTADVDGLAGFLGATGWKAIYAVNFKTSTPTLAAAEATYVASKLGANLAGFEIGNEPNFIGSWASVRAKWESFANAIRAAVPNAPLVGPSAYGAESSGGVSYAASFAADEASRTTMLTQHYYIAGAGSGSTLAAMLAPKPNVAALSTGMTAAVKTNHIRDGYRWDEMNSYAHHGAPGVSDALGSAFWGIDFMLTTALYDAAGVNFHGGSTGMDGTVPFTYAPIKETAGRVDSASPLFYGMLLVARAGTGPMLTTRASVGSLNFSAYTIAPTGGGTNVVLVNKDTTTGVRASINVGVAASSAIAVYLQGPSLGALTGQTFAGAGISAQGAWTPKAPYALTVSGNVISVLVPPASAVLVQAQ